MMMPKYYVAFRCSHKTMIKKQLEDYADMLSKKYENITSVVDNDGMLKMHTFELGESVKTALNGLRDNGFIFNPDSYIELHRPYVISKVTDLKRLIVGVLRAQVQNHLINKNYYNSKHQIFDNDIIKGLSSANDVLEFCKIYYKTPSEGVDEESIKEIIEEKNIKQPSWLDMTPSLRSYFKMKYESIEEPNGGKETFYLHLPILSKDEDTKSVEYSLVTGRISILLKSMQAIIGT